MSEPWKLLKSEKVFDSKYIKIAKEEILLPDGRVIDDYFTFTDQRDFVTIIPVLDNGNILMIEEWAYPINESLIQFPEGIIDDGEDCLEAAKRELIEETGYSASEFMILGSCLANHRRSKYKQFVVVAKNSKKISDPNFKGLEGSITPKIITKNDISDYINKGIIMQRNAISAWSYFLTSDIKD